MSTAKIPRKPLPVSVASGGYSEVPLNDKKHHVSSTHEPLMGIGNETSSSEYVPDFVEKPTTRRFFLPFWKTADRRKSSTPNPYRRIYWKVPVLLVTTLALGVASALGHHFLYKHYDGREVKDTVQQEWIVLGGTALAFLTKTFLASALTMAYAQHAWLTFRKKYVTVQAIDSIFAASHNLWSFLNEEMYRRAKTATLLALVIWILPISAIPTPAALSVVLKPLSTNVSTPVPFLDYSNADAFSQWNGKSAAYNGPQTVVSRMATASVMNWEIMPIEAPFPNSSYTTSFYGMSVKCDPANSTTQNIISQVIGTAFTYTAFTPEILFHNTTTDNYSVDWAQFQTEYYRSFGPSGEIWIGTNPKYTNADMEHNTTEFPAHKYVVCALYNTSYTVDFNFTQNLQTVSFQHVQPIQTMGRPEANAQTSPFDGKRLRRDGDINKRQVRGQMTEQEFIGTSMGATWDALADVIVGTMEGGFDGLAINTKIIQTKLIHGPDLAIGTFDQNFDIEVLYPNLTLENGIEELSRNVTLSMFAQGNLAGLTNQTVFYSSDLLFYTYNSDTLLISYGCASLVALLGVLMGFRACILQGTIDNAAFSTIFMATRNPELRNIVGNEESGIHQVPASLKQTSLKFGRKAFEERVEGNRTVKSSHDVFHVAERDFDSHEI